MIQIAKNYGGDLSDFLSRYKYYTSDGNERADDQLKLTPKLDALPDAPFSQEIVNEIVLWKVNRYVRLDAGLLRDLYKLKNLQPKDHRNGAEVLLKLLGTRGVDLPMASTLLRFQARDVFQIIDRHAYRAVFGEPYPLYSASKREKKVSTYFGYLDSLHNLAKSSGTPFRDLDRILYVFDKEQNGSFRPTTAIPQNDTG